MYHVQFQGLNIQGLSVRTRNTDEAQPDRARIASLWRKFAVQVAPHLKRGAAIYGVGLYAVFRAHGATPEAVIAAWGRVWAYFADSNALYQRAYTWDFERYGPDGHVDLCIALVAP